MLEFTFLHKRLIMIKIGLFGANGRMGLQIKDCIKYDKEAFISTCFDKNLGFESFFKDSDLIIDFSSKQGTSSLLEFAKTSPKALLIGTTGLDVEFDTMKELAKKMPIFYASNTSLGIAVLSYLAQKAATMLNDFDIEILEMHHRHKKDAPSGTALSLAQAVAKAKRLELEKVMITDRKEARKKDEISVLSLRGGDIVGKHTVGFYADGEFLELSHNATSRATFANGAIKIAKWLNKKEAGFYSINDMLGL